MSALEILFVKEIVKTVRLTEFSLGEQVYRRVNFRAMFTEKEELIQVNEEPPLRRV